MPRDVRHRAANMINSLVLAHVDDGAADIDVHQAMAVRDDIREAARDSTDHDRYIPVRGVTMLDTDAPHWSQDETVGVLSVLVGVRADEYIIGGPNAGSILPPRLQSALDTTVADKNDDEYADENILVKARYAEGNGNEYVFPLARLEQP